MSSYYMPVPLAENDDEGMNHERKVPSGWSYRFPWTHVFTKTNHPLWLNLWLLFNTIFSVVILLVAISVMRRAKELPYRPVPVYSPVREDGAEHYFNTQYQPDKIFQSPPSDQVDKAWHDWLQEHDHLFKFPKHKAKQFGLPEAIELYNDPGYGAYGLGVYHQMHCLNRIRKSFYPERYYPGESQHEVLHHTNHCFDVLRQTVLCHGDISVVYWWNQNYTFVDQLGNRRYTEEYLRLSPEQRATNSFVKWDSKLQCRDMDAINAWAKANQVDDDKYGGQLVD
ncbi:hypothetical protein EsDP_00004810 [Epichloe bromicola]|uniref:Uncharacterized protein n=1 Tax=Epichloe bromicola TaxID=79588 RepID=A0ABQ0CSX9_9HYPO